MGIRAILAQNVPVVEGMRVFGRAGASQNGARHLEQRWRGWLILTRVLPVQIWRKDNGSCEAQFFNDDRVEQDA
jgi:hypothetical protein